MTEILNRLGISTMTASGEFAYGPEVFLERAAALIYSVFTFIRFLP